MDIQAKREVVGGGWAGFLYFSGEAAETPSAEVAAKRPSEAT